ncbi:MAG: hypothetical protein J5598_01160 [Clostridia bacterium]|nr:hypothetical protein [Clostridia bacterium]
MKHWWKILALCLVCSTSAIIFTGCVENEISASDDKIVEEQIVDENNIIDDGDQSVTDHPNDTENNTDDGNNTKQEDPQNNVTLVPNDDESTTGEDSNQTPNDGIGNETPTPHDENNDDNNNQVGDNSNEGEPGEPEDPQEPKAPHQHTPSETWTVTADATCEKDGTKVLYCTECGEIIEIQTIEATGHSYTHYVTEPTCTAGGYTTHACTRCGHSYIDTETKALGHDYEHVVTDPTCTEAGYTTHTCTRCGGTYTDSETLALGHEFDDETHHCTRCGIADPDYVDPDYVDPDALMQNPANTYWYFTYGSKNRIIAFYFTEYNENIKQGKYCAFKGEIENGKFIKYADPQSAKSDYNGTYDIIKSNGEYSIHFHDDYCQNYNENHDGTYVYDFTLTFDKNTYTLIDENEYSDYNLIYKNKTITFGGYAD